MLSELQDLVDTFINNVPLFIFALVIFIAAEVFSKVIERWAERSLRKKIEDPDTRTFLARAARYAVLVLGTLAALEQIPGIQITSFLAGLGILGFTIGFALQDIARNFIAGLLLLMRQPFSVGDAVQVAGELPVPRSARHLQEQLDHVTAHVPARCPAAAHLRHERVEGFVELRFVPAPDR